MSNTETFEPTAPSGPSRADVFYVDSRPNMSKTNLAPSLDVPAAAQRWREEAERVRLTVSKVRHRISDELAQDSTTIEAVLSNALDAAQAKRAVPDLLVDIENAYRRHERATAANTAMAKLDALHSAELASRLREVEGELRELVGEEIRAVLADALRLAIALDGIGTAEAAMTSGKSAEWLERQALTGRWLACQRSRAWLGQAATGFAQPLPGTAPGRLRRDGVAELARATWASQFEGHQVSEYDTAADVLAWFVAETDDGHQPTPLV